MRLYIGNKNYSSWSLCVWLTLRVKGLAFDEVLRPFDVGNDFADYFEFSPSGRVPTLVDGCTTVWESLAILEYVAEQKPNAGLWPTARGARTFARCIAHEAHAGFAALRTACPLNMRRPIAALGIDRVVRKDVSRIEAIWTQCLNLYGGPYLLGSSFTIADGLFAP
ncbi:MAG: glutathione S-transferase N-terminal domain-containing protein, partial [Myxococcota bacterium]